MTAQSFHARVFGIASTLDPRDRGPYANGYGHAYDAIRHAAAEIAAEADAALAARDALIERLGQAAERVFDCYQVSHSPATRSDCWRQVEGALAAYVAHKEQQ